MPSHGYRRSAHRRCDSLSSRRSFRASRSLIPSCHEMSETTGKPVAEQRGRSLSLAIAVALLLGLSISALAAVLEHGELACLVIPALVVFWCWVALGTCVGLLIIDRRLAPMAAWQAHTAALLTALLCGMGLFTGAHEYVLRSVRQLLRFSQDLIGYYLVSLQLLYFVAAALASFLASAAVHSIDCLQHRRGEPFGS